MNLEPKREVRVGNRDLRPWTVVSVHNEGQMQSKSGECREQNPGWGSGSRQLGMGLREKEAEEERGQSLTPRKGEWLERRTSCRDLRGRTAD